jgi:hypothetical protein
MLFAIRQKQVPINWSSVLLWVAITLLFLYERTYLIQKAGLPHFLICTGVRIGLLLLLCYGHNEGLTRLLSAKKYGYYVLSTGTAIAAYLLVQGLYDQYLFGFVIGDQEQAGLWQNLPYNLLVTIWYLLLTYLVKRAVNPTNPTEPVLNPANQTITVKTGTQWVQLPVADVLYAQGLKDYTILFTEREKYVLKGSIGTVASQLPDGLFVRVHKSYLVSRRHIRSVSSTGIALDGQTIPVGRLYTSAVQKEFMRREMSRVEKSFGND